jgi:hypothetical protein
VCDVEVTDRAAVDGVPVLEDTVEDGRVGEDDEAEAARAAGGLLTHDDSLRDVPVLAEVFPQGVLVRIPCYSSNENFPFVRIHVSLTFPLRLNRIPPHTLLFCKCEKVATRGGK